MPDDSNATSTSTSGSLTAVGLNCSLKPSGDSSTETLVSEVLDELRGHGVTAARSFGSRPRASSPASPRMKATAMVGRRCVPRSWPPTSWCSGRRSGWAIRRQRGRGPQRRRGVVPGAERRRLHDPCAWHDLLGRRGDAQGRLPRSRTPPGQNSRSDRDGGDECCAPRTAVAGERLSKNFVTSRTQSRWCVKRLRPASILKCHG